MNSSSDVRPRVVAVHRSSTHTFSKFEVDAIELIAGIGVLDDAHAGVTVKHRSRVAMIEAGRADASTPNLRQVHLIAVETLDELGAKGHPIRPGELGENVTMSGIDLFSLLTGARLEFEGGVVVSITGLRNPCRQIEEFRPGLLAEVRSERPDGSVVRRVGVMGVVVHGGTIAVGAKVTVKDPPAGASPLLVV